MVDVAEGVRVINLKEHRQRLIWISRLPIDAYVSLSETFGDT